MSSHGVPNRRLSGRSQEKEDAAAGSAKDAVNGALTHHPHHPHHPSHAMRTPARASKEKKRKMNYDEEDDGFLFKRVKKSKTTRVPDTSSAHHDGPREPVKESSRSTRSTLVEVRNHDAHASPQSQSQKQSQKRRSRMSFSTTKPEPKVDGPVRRSKRLSQENRGGTTGPSQDAAAAVEKGSRSPRREEPVREPSHNKAAPPASPVRRQSTVENIPTHQEGHAATKIALPFADTPVIKRNKAMREVNAGKGDRRSSLSLRGRRASSLIEAGSSNALPHSEVEIHEFYKHIASDGLPEPRRMRQLLTWCATRALDAKPVGTDFDDASARSAARVIEEELLKELSDKPELSDWFGVPDVPVTQAPLPERPHPKNIHNRDKIAELEEQIRRLRAEKDALESLLQSPPPPGSAMPPHTDAPPRSLLTEQDAAGWDSTTTTATSSRRIAERLHHIYDALGPTMDQFADGVHAIGQYRQGADNVASRVLAMCAEMLVQREKQGRKRALHAPAGDDSPPRDLGGVLRSLSKVDR